MGTFTHRNWLAYQAGSRGDAFEHPLYSDATFIAEITTGLGPYEILNTVARSRESRVAPAAILRMELCFQPAFAMERTDASTHHGGFPQDEVAALLSLELGARFKAAGATRWFKAGDDPRGHPWAVSHVRQGVPTLETPPYGYMLPNVREEKDFRHVRLLQRFPELHPEQAIAIVRAARLYQDATWTADREPELSWILLVSAIEVAANYWRAGSEPALDRLRTSRPELIELLEQNGAGALVGPVAEILAPYLGATRKFLDFIRTFLPEPPEVRPEVGDQMPWEHADLERALKLIYAYRSKALHNGTPFPAPMCMPPTQQPPEERPFGLAAGSMGSTWLARDLPMLLHTFAHVVRGSLLNWWRSLLVDIAMPVTQAP